MNGYLSEIGRYIKSKYLQIKLTRIEDRLERLEENGMNISNSADYRKFHFKLLQARLEFDKLKRYQI